LKKINETEFLKKSTETLRELLGSLNKLPIVHLKDLPREQTALIIIDMINGFTREGALKSGRIADTIPAVAELSRRCGEYRIARIAFADNHSVSAAEFEAYPPHSIEGTHEAEIVDELKEIGGYILIPKNSTNSLLEGKFQKWLEQNPRINTFVVAGDCTDICILQFALTLKAWFNIPDKRSRVIVPVNAVDTYDLGVHDGDLMNVIALYNMMLNGVEVVKEVK
jgi:nicotinamidase-related amidase